MSSRIEKKIDQYQAFAEQHASKCAELINAGGLAEAMTYSEMQRITPPTCSLTAQSANAKQGRAKASRMLSEKKWWLRRLKNQAIQDCEHEQRKQGNVTNYISNELSDYCEKHMTK